MTVYFNFKDVQSRTNGIYFPRIFIPNIISLGG